MTLVAMHAFGSEVRAEMPSILHSAVNMVNYSNKNRHSCKVDPAPLTPDLHAPPVMLMAASRQLVSTQNECNSARSEVEVPRALVVVTAPNPMHACTD